ncbi:DNA primase [Buchananella felis]|uniref:DNA primase n=1 Tax=Buchananella felis TaxID=3231492 RepID=UPI0035282840
MSNEPRVALDQLIRALETHFEACRAGSADSPAVVRAESVLEDAFFTYDDALIRAFGASLPFDIFEDEELDEDDEDDDLYYDDEDDSEDEDDEFYDDEDEEDDD